MGIRMLETGTTIRNSSKNTIRILVNGKWEELKPGDSATYYEGTLEAIQTLEDGVVTDTTKVGTTSEEASEIDIKDDEAREGKAAQSGHTVLRLRGGGDQTTHNV
ncbi:hypothetical protein RHS03_09829, partial [Rhizoctonia solani]